MTKRKYIINFAVCIILGVFSGYAIGSYFTKGNFVSLANNYIEWESGNANSLRDFDVNASSLPTKYVTASGNYTTDPTSTSLTPIEIFEIGEYKLNHQQYIQKNIVGNITAKTLVTVNQTLQSTKIRRANNYFIEKISASSFAKVATRVYYDTNSDTYLTKQGTDVTSTTATWPVSGTTNNISQYRVDYGSGVNYFINYIVSSKTVKESKRIDNAENGNYRYQIKLDIEIDSAKGTYNYAGVSNYVNEIKQNAGTTEFPNFNYVTIVMEMNDSWDIISLTVNEEYSVPIMGTTTCTCVMTESFIIDEALVQDIPQ